MAKAIKIILDTNFFVYCAKQKLDYLDKISEIVNTNYNLIVLSSVLVELEKLSRKLKKLKERDSVKLALKILESYIKQDKIKVIKTDKGADETIENLAESESLIVATSDRELKKKIKNKARILAIRQERNLEII